MAVQIASMAQNDFAGRSVPVQVSGSVQHGAFPVVEGSAGRRGGIAGFRSVTARHKTRIRQLAESRNRKKKNGELGAARRNAFKKPVKDDVEFLRSAARFVQLTDQLNRLTQVGVASVQPLERQRSRVGHCRTRCSSISTAMTVKVEFLLLR